MKRGKTIIAIALCILILSAIPTSFQQLPGEQSLSNLRSVFILSSSLREIGKEAFADTSVEIVIIPPTKITIGERAFADNQKLRIISIPKFVAFIDDTAFENVPALTINTPKNSYAATWAQRHDIAVTSEPILLSKEKNRGEVSKSEVIFLLCFISVLAAQGLWRKRNTIRVICMRPQDRIELYPINYKFP